MNRVRTGPLLAIGTAAGCVIAAVVSGVRLEGYSHLAHPLALPGARQLGAAGLLFGLFAFVLPGLVQAWQAWRLRDALPAAGGRIAGIGLQLLLLAALAFAAQGLLPLDLESLDSGASRWHALAWLVWALAFPLGALLAAAGSWRRPGRRPAAGMLLAAGVLVACGAFLGNGAVAPLLQRVAVLAWLLWGAYAALRTPLSRGAA